MKKVKGFQDTIEWYNQNAETYGKAGMEFASATDISNFVAELGANTKVLDAGCGGGRDTFLLTKQGLQVTGLDLSSGLIRVAKEQYPELTFFEGNFLALPFLDETFDGVWSNASLLHLETVEDVAKALQEFWRVLKKDGILHVRVKAQTGAEKTAVISDSLSNHDRFFQYFKKEELEDLIMQAKFTIIRTRQFREIEEIKNGRADLEILVTLAKKSAGGRG